MSRLKYNLRGVGYIMPWPWAPTLPSDCLSRLLALQSAPLVVVLVVACCSLAVRLCLGERKPFCCCCARVGHRSAQLRGFLSPCSKELHPWPHWGSGPRVRASVQVSHVSGLCCVLPTAFPQPVSLSGLWEWGQGWDEQRPDSVSPLQRFSQMFSI